MKTRRIEDLGRFGVSVERAEAGSRRVWRLVELRRTDHDGKHHVYVEAKGEDGNRDPDARIHFDPGNGGEIRTQDKPLSEYGANFPMWSGQICTVRIQEPGVPSDRVTGLKALTPGSHGHQAFYLTYQREIERETPGEPTNGAAASLVWPVAGRITQHHGEHDDWYPNSIMGHMGVDISAAAEMPIRAMAAGVVAYAAWDDDYGHYIRLYHEALRIHTFYAHMQAPSPLAVGASVAAGDVIGRVGSTGRSTGPHLHLEVRLANGRGYAGSAANPKAQVDPVVFFAWLTAGGGATR